MTDNNLALNENGSVVANLYNTKKDMINPLPSKKVVEDYYHSKGNNKEKLKTRIIDVFNERREKLNKIYSEKLAKFEMELSVKVVHFKRGEVLAIKFKSMNSLGQRPIKSKTCKLICTLMLIKINLRRMLLRIRKKIENKRIGIAVALPLLRIQPSFLNMGEDKNKSNSS